MPARKVIKGGVKPKMAQKAKKQASSASSGIKKVRKIVSYRTK